MSEEDNRKAMGEAWDKAFENEGVRIPVGRIVLCDDCNGDWTDRKDSGGMLFESKGICPDCEPKWTNLAELHHEEFAIRGRCPELMSFADWIRDIRGEDAAIVVTVGLRR
jgi:hypothetical protein